MRTLIIPAVGDQVHVSSDVHGNEYSDTGVVTAMRRDSVYPAWLITVNSNYYLLDKNTTCMPVQPEGARCRLCGETSVEMEPVQVYVSIDEDGEPDEAGCFTDSRVEWKCADHTACAQHRRDAWQVAKAIAVADDAAAREAGWGATHG